MQEIWKAIPGYEGKYEISDQGRVRALATQVKRRNAYGRAYIGMKKEKLLTLETDEKGYVHTTLCLEGKPKRFLVARLVLATFVGEGKGLIAFHCNKQQSDNRLINLRYVTRKELCKDV